MPENATFTDKRKYPRLAIQLNILFKPFKSPEGSYTKEITNSIGEGGCFIRSKSGFARETELQMEITLKDRKIAARGVVRYLVPYDSSADIVQFPGMGVQFTAISPDDREFISNFVAGELKKQRKS